MPNSLDTFRIMLFPLFVGTFPYKYLNIFCIFSFLFMEKANHFVIIQTAAGIFLFQWLFEYLAIVKQGGKILGFFFIISTFFFLWFGLVW